MTDFGARPPFVARDYFLETAFELRFQGLVRSAWQHRTQAGSLRRSREAENPWGLPISLSRAIRTRTRGEEHTCPFSRFVLPRMGGKILLWGWHSVLLSVSYPPCPGMCAAPGWFRP
jgi:hypothetical protein